MEKRTFSLQVSGMACSACTKRVTDALAGIDCVKSVEVDLASGVATIACTNRGADPQQFVDTIEKLGFEAQLRN